MKGGGGGGRKRRRRREGGGGRGKEGREKGSVRVTSHNQQVRRIDKMDIIYCGTESVVSGQIASCMVTNSAWALICFPGARALVEMCCLREVQNVG